MCVSGACGAVRCASASWLPPSAASMEVAASSRVGGVTTYRPTYMLGGALSGQAYWSLRGLGTSPGSSTRSAEIVRGAGACRGVGGGLSACGVSRVVCSCVCAWCAWCAWWAVSVCVCGAVRCSFLGYGSIVTAP